ncbi:gliding motility-associated C-terminal domain-containing protein [Hymenobacter sp. IS2118]|uniref:gliding motility-associated C-terminal domain-containing protein n=1 Tax=Hymenobacter sp. IS2118 TaxID=1505605 RepID=UPI000550B27C|nr:gliding motility-associated C-terminal domain-containing protein [Hymenobacter sp. IS2118]
MPAALPYPSRSSSTNFPAFNAKRGPAAARRTRSAAWLLTLLLLLSGAATTALAQGNPPPECAADEKFANTWYFGFKAGLNLNQASADSLPKVLTNGAMDAPAGSGVMSDKDGNILFYSNGRTVWNGNGTVMTNGRGLAGDSTTTDGPLPLKMPGLVMPGQPTRYLLFTLNSTVGLSYSEIQIPAGGGSGTVILATKNTPLARGTAEKLTAVFHKNGCDIWVITHGWGAAKSGNDNRGDAFLAYRVRQSAGYTGPIVIDAPIVSTVGSLHAPSEAALGYKGQMKITPDGRRLALARYSEVLGDNSSTVELFGFDTGTGDVSVNPQVPFIVDSGEGKYYGVGFSAGGYLYATVMNPPKLLQFDSTSTGPVVKRDIPLNQTAPADLGALQAGPDGRIYVARNNQPALGFIAYPDSLGAAIGYADDSLQLGGRLSGLGLVNFNQSSLLRVGPSFEIVGCREIKFTAPPIDFAPVTYTWTFGNGNTFIGKNPPSQIFTADVRTHTVKLLISTECFCRESSGTVQIPNLPVPGSIAASPTVCAGQMPALITSTRNASSDAGLPLVYQWQILRNGNWQNAPGVSTGPTYQPPTSQTPGPTSFRRRAQLLLPNGSGPYCTPDFTDPVIITVLPLTTPTVSLAAPPVQCPGTNLNFTAVTTNVGTTPTFRWFVNNVAVAATGRTFSSNTLVTGDRVRVEVTATAGTCSTGPASATATVTRTVVPPPTLTIAVQPRGPVCLGTLLTFSIDNVTNAGQARQYQWQVDGVDVVGKTGRTFTSALLRNGQTVTLRLRTTNVCGQSVTVVSNGVRVQIQQPVTPTVTLAPPPVQCPGTPLTFTAVPTNAGATPTFRWFVNNVAATATGATFSSSTLVSGDRVRVEVTAAAGTCSTGPASATVTVTRTATPLPTLTIAVQPAGPVCPGEPLTFSIANVTNEGPAPAYQWLVNGNNASGAGTTTPVFTSTTLRDGQTVTLRLRTTNVCGQPVTVVSNGIVVRISPPADVDAGPDKEILAGTSVTLEGRVEGPYPVTWTPATGLAFPGDSLRPVASPLVTTTYTLSAGTGGCADSDQVTVTVRPAIRIPNAFTPNGDGRDDTWQIEFIEQYPNNTVTVFNRWGNKVFSADNYSRSNEWRGQINGQPAPVGTYYYVVVTRGPLGKSYSGSLTVLY